jgi:hypothetical protein
LDLLHLLNNHQLKHIPVSVFTQDQQGVQNHLEHEAKSMGINDWKQRLHITNNKEDLIIKSKANITNKPGNHHH